MLKNDSEICITYLLIDLCYYNIYLTTLQRFINMLVIIILIGAA